MMTNACVAQSLNEATQSTLSEMVSLGIPLVRVLGFMGSPFCGVVSAVVFFGITSMASSVFTYEVDQNNPTTRKLACLAAESLTLGGALAICPNPKLGAVIMGSLFGISHFSGKDEVICFNITAMKGFL